MYSLTVGGGVENMVCTIEISKTFVEYKSIHYFDTNTLSQCSRTVWDGGGLEGQ